MRNRALMVPRKILGDLIRKKGNQNCFGVAVFRPINTLSPDCKPTLKFDQHQFQPRIVS